MTRPHPVIGVSAELADRRGRRADQAHIGKDLDHKSKILVSAEEGLDLHFHPGILAAEAFRNGLHLSGDQFLAFFPAGDVGHGAQHVGSHVDDLADKPHLESRSRKFFGTRHGPEAIFQVVVLHRRKGLNRAVTAVVIREQQSVGRYDLTRASAPEDDDGVLERRFVHAVNLLGRELASARLHILAVHFLEIGQHPHALVGRCRKRDACRGEQ